MTFFFSQVLEGVEKRDYGLDNVSSLREWVASQNSGVEPEEQEVLVQSCKELWLEMCESLESEEGAHLMERVKEEKMAIVADLSTREIAEKKMRRGRGMAEASSLADAMASVERNSISTSEAMTMQAEMRAKLESERLHLQDSWKQREVRLLLLLLLLLLMLLLPLLLLLLLLLLFSLLLLHILLLLLLLLLMLLLLLLLMMLLLLLLL